MTPAAPASDAPPAEHRRHDILQASVSCFARKGLHLTTMQDISQEAGISVGLIYRYFASKEQVIATMAEQHVLDLAGKLTEARKMPSLLAALETVLWCDAHGPEVAASLVIDLHGESARNPAVRGHVVRVRAAILQGVTELIVASPDAARLAPGISPGEAAAMVFQAIHGLMFDEVILGSSTPEATARLRRETLVRLWSLLFPVTAKGAKGASQGSAA